MLEPVLRGSAGERGALAARLQGAAGALVRHLILSEENMLGGAHGGATLRAGRFYPAADQRLSRVLTEFGGAEAHLWLALRDPAGYFASLYSQRILSGRILTFAAFLGELEVTEIRWSELVARLLAVPGVSAITVWRFEDYPAVAGRVLGAMLGQETAAGLRPPGHLIHPGLSRRAWETVMREGGALDRTEASRLANAARRRFPRTGPGDGLQPFPAILRDTSAAAYVRDIARIAAMEGVRFLGPPAQG